MVSSRMIRKSQDCANETKQTDASLNNRHGLTGPQGSLICGYASPGAGLWQRVCDLLFAP